MIELEDRTEVRFLVADPEGRIDRAVAALQRGEVVLLQGDEQTWMVTAADRISPDAVNFLATEARGLVSLALPGRHCDRLGLRPMRPGRELEPGAIAYTVTIEARHGVTTGISTADRATTILAAVAPDAVPVDLVVPGHVMPIRADDAGVRGRLGLAEAAIDLVSAAGCARAAATSAVLDDRGDVADAVAVGRLAARCGLEVVTLADVARHHGCVPAAGAPD